MRRELIRKVRTERRERGEDEWPSPRFSLAAPKRKPRHLTDGRGFGARALGRSMALRHSERDCSGLLAVRPVVKNEKADEECNGKASR